MNPEALPLLGSERQESPNFPGILDPFANLSSASELRLRKFFQPVAAGMADCRSLIENPRAAAFGINDWSNPRSCNQIPV
jgi:hypothetical protein